MTSSQPWQRTRRRAAGVSLIEALVALAVMAFGLLGVVGMQSTMRNGADISRQRSEAVRLAQEQLERLRNYSVLRAADAAAGQLAFESIAAAAAASVAASNANTTFWLETVAVVPTAAASDAMARVTQVRVIVTWADRSASTPNQRVELSSVIAGLPAEMSALHALRTDRSPLRRAKGRHSAIPSGATDQLDGTSQFTPPLSGVTWTFDNATGVILQTCVSGTCDDYGTLRWLLSGYVAFATVDQPTAAEAEVPTDSVVNLSMRVSVLEPLGTPDETCVIANVPGQPRKVYYCAVPVDGFLIWSGRVIFDTPLSLSSVLSDNSLTNYKVCRYTPDSINVLPVSPNPLPTVPTGQSVADYNSRHPYIYYKVNGPLQNKNFLIISAGDGTSAPPFDCPAEDTAPTSPIESNTWRHQPIS
jgi:Tfp pilus assembly protein PilV